MTRINLRVLVIDKLAFFLASIYNWKETKDDFLRSRNQYLPIDKTNKMKAAKKFFTRVALTMIAIFVFESIYNWNESETPL
jgi:hypothetical protein